ncbi:cobalamin biosynthesis protein CobW [Candidatus Woesebacteria bacterium]|nr:cobalamin biosynthesis protein CobW [Candidatus Woesebacteria bacterium]
MQQVPTTVFSGFLGSGKTTIISKLIDTLQANRQQVVYIKNEIGEENIDSKILSGQQIQTRELLNGCICCTLVGPFITAIDEVISTLHPDRIIIEASGAADPAAIALMIDSHPKLIRDGVISIIDVVNFEGYKDLSHTAQNQTSFTDLLVFNKVELVDEKRKEAVVGYVRELNSHSPVVEAPHGVLRPEVAFGLADAELNALLHNEERGESHEHHEDHLAEDGIETLHFTATAVVVREKIEKFLRELPGAVYRVKGFAQIGISETVMINKVGVRTDLSAAHKEFELQGASVVCIGFHLERMRTRLESAWKQVLEETT